MAFSWGSTELKVVVDSVKITPASGSLTEIPLLPDPLALSVISTVIQQQGRKRKKIEARLYITNMSEYNAFVTDMDSGTSRSLSFSIGSVSGTYLIEKVGEPEFIFYDIILFDVTWLEV